MSSHVVVEDVRAIESLEFTVPDRGGVVVLRGPNGSGKTTALEAIDGALGGKSKLTPRDGAEKGFVDAFGVTLKVGKRVTAKGELEVAPLDSGLSPATLVDPGIKSADAADAARVKAVLSILGVEAGPTMFRELLELAGVTHEVLVEEDFDGKEPGIVDYAKAVKRRLDAKARAHEDAAERDRGRADVKRKALEGIDVEDLPTVEEANAELTNAIERDAKLRKQAELAVQLREAAEASRKQIAALEGVDADEAAKAAVEKTEAEEARKSAGKIVEDASDRLAEAKAALEAAESEWEDSQQHLVRMEEREAVADKRLGEIKELARQQDVIRETCQAAITRYEMTPSPTEADLADAAAAVETARKVSNQIAVAAKGQADVEAAKSFRQDARLSDWEAAKCRKMGKKADEILSDQIAGKVDGLTVEDGRLLLKTSRKKPVPFAELSHGERWKLALDIVLSAVERDEGQTVVISIPQEAWEGLDDNNRSAIQSAAIERRVVILTAECSAEGPLSAEVLK